MEEVQGEEFGESEMDDAESGEYEWEEFEEE